MSPNDRVTFNMPLMRPFSTAPPIRRILSFSFIAKQLCWFDSGMALNVPGAASRARKPAESPRLAIQHTAPSDSRTMAQQPSITPDCSVAIRWSTRAKVSLRILRIVLSVRGSSACLTTCVASSAGSAWRTKLDVCLPPCPSKMAQRAKSRSSETSAFTARREAQTTLVSSICRRWPCSPCTPILRWKLSRLIVASSTKRLGSIIRRGFFSAGVSTTTSSSSPSSFGRFSGWTPLGKYELKSFVVMLMMSPSLGL
mmetsp:Transcript_26698/g.69778  ORF Transcript_26698/g.69778 Transcript_26698/m.69778 type:complete len:255 (+) Transcript_26698:531-1295(+)